MRWNVAFPETKKTIKTVGIMMLPQGNLFANSESPISFGKSYGSNKTLFNQLNPKEEGDDGIEEAPKGQGYSTSLGSRVAY